MKKSKFYIKNMETNELHEEVYTDFNKAIDGFVEMFSITDGIKLNVEHQVKDLRTLGRTVIYDLGIDNWKIVQKIE